MFKTFNRFSACLSAGALLSLSACAHSAQSVADPIMIGPFTSRALPPEPPSAEAQSDLATVRTMATEFAAAEAVRREQERRRLAAEFPEDAGKEAYHFPNGCGVAYPQIKIDPVADRGNALVLARPLIRQEVARIELLSLGYPEVIVDRALAEYEQIEHSRNSTDWPIEKYDAEAQDFATQHLYGREAFVEGYRVALLSLDQPNVQGDNGPEFDVDRWFRPDHLSMAVAATILNEYRLNHAPQLRPVAVRDASCRRTIRPVRINIEPGNGWGAVIPQFNYRFCEAANKDLKELGKCPGWVRFEDNDPVFLAFGGAYIMVGRWPGDERTEIPVRINSNTLRLRSQ